ncbi:MAG: hypothetical protein NTW25_13715 [Candidatus Kapabacteria bacterium]|nr:hypothetical protein [Candidatus Kapabacteria bacterium]
MLLYKKFISFKLSLILTFILSFGLHLYTAFAQDSFGQLNGPDGGEIKVLTVGASDAIYAGTWGSGLLRSVNSGVSWTIINTGLTNMYITDIKYTSQSLIYVSTWGGGIFRSNDNGGTWIEQNNGLTNLKVKCLLVKTKDTLFAGTFGDGIFRSTDAGVSWKPSSFGLTYKDVNCLTTTRDGNIVLGTYGAGLFLSSDNGNTWKNNNGGVGSKFINTFYYRKDSVTVVATNGKGLYITDNNAKSWYEFQDATDSKIEDQNITCVTSLTLKGINEFIVGTRSKGVYYYASVSYDQFRPSSIISGGVNAIVKLSNGDLVAAIPRRGIYKSTDGGVIWAYKAQGFNQDKDLYKLYKPKGNLMYATTKDGGLFRSLDNGKSWSLSGFAGQVIQDFLITSTNKLIVEINKNPRDAMWSSLDSGATWFINPGVADSVVSLIQLANNDIIAYFMRFKSMTSPPDIRFKRSTDGGATYAEGIPSFIDSGSVFKCIQRPNGNIFGFLNNRSSGVPSIYKSLNNGNTYSLLSTFTATITVKDISSAPDNTLYLSTTNGLYKSVNDGVSWSIDNLGFISPNTSANANINGIAFKSSSELYAATDNTDGFYKTSDTGQN